MKKVVFVLIAFIALNAQAQKEHSRKENNMTPEQMATMKTKQMTLVLDLSEVQQKDVLALNKKNAENFSKARGEKKELTQEERFEMKNKMLDAQIANQRAMRKILNDDQYVKWRKMQHMRTKKMDDVRKQKMRKHYMAKKKKHECTEECKHEK